MDSEALKPCPFCGGEVEMDIMRGYSHYPPDRTLFKTSTEVAIYCLSCHAEMAFDSDENGDTRERVESWLVEAWNTRVDDDRIEALQARVKVLEEALNAIIDRGTMVTRWLPEAERLVLANRPEAVEE